MSGNLKTFRIALAMFFCLFAAAVQAQTITGNVKDSTGEGVIGATVMEVGTTNGTVTDFDGNFTLKLTGKHDIQISYIGMKTQVIKTAGKTTIDVVLEDDATTLQDVVVIGYGTMKKSDLTGSVSSIETEKLNAKGAASALGNLQGSVPGVNITQSSGRSGGGFNVEIRGKSSLGDTKPIYVIDGVICSDMDFLNPQDIERIDVLKDASSTAIYGSRATAGVVMVTTKSGSGVAKKASKPSVTYDGYVGFTNVARMPDFMDGQEFYNYRFSKFLTYAEGGQATAQSGQPGYTMGTYPQMALWKTDDSAAGGYSRLKQLMKEGATFDWPSEVTRNGMQQNHYLAVSGSVGEHNDVSYHMGIGYNQDKGVYTGDEQTRINFKGSVDARLSKWLNGGFSVNVSRQINDYADDNGVQYAYRMNPFMQAYNADGEMNIKPGDYISMGSDNGYQFSDQVSPLVLLANQTKNRESWRLLGNIYLELKPIDGVTLKTTFAPNFSYSRTGTFNDANDLIKGYEDNNGEGDGNRAIMSPSRSLSYTWTNQINYQKTFNDVHSVNLMALNEVIYANSENMSVTARRVIDGSLWYNLGSSSNPSAATYSSNYGENSMTSYAIRANYSYAGKYMLTGTVRWDGSSRFDRGKKWGSFPSLAAAWRISEEEFMKPIDWISNLKLRLSYGLTGNNSVDNYATQQTVKSGHYYPFGSSTLTGYYPSGVVDTGLTWETSTEYNLGIDFGFLRNRISGSIDIYQKTANELLYPVKLPLEAGLNSDGSIKVMETNVGTVRNRGIEISLTTVNVETKDWNWTTSFNFAHNQNRIREINGTGQDDPANNFFIGQPINIFQMYNWTGIVNDKMMTVPDNDAARAFGFTPGDQVKSYDYYYKVYGWTEGNPIIEDVNGDGTINTEDMKIFKKDPTWTGSFTSNLSYKEWDFSFSLYAKQGYKVLSNFYEEYMNYGDRGRMHLQMDYYIPAGTLIDCDGTNADGTYINPVYQTQTHYGHYPFPNNGAANGGIGSAYWTGNANKVADASFVKVKNITLGYTFDKKLLSKIGIQKLRLYCTVTNPFVFTKYKGFDPEWADASNKLDGPSTITYQFGASLKF